MADTLSPPQAGAIGAVLLVAAVAGYGLLLVDERLGTLHLTPGEIRGLRAPDTGPSGQLPSAAKPTSGASAAADKGPKTGPNRHVRHSKELSADAPAGPASPAAFNRIAPPAYLAQIARPAASALVDANTPTDRRFVIRRILPVAGPIRYGEWHWDEAGVPPGPLVITVDLEARVISAFRAGYEIGTAAVLLGTDEYPTPTGMSQKDAHHISNI